MKKIFIISYDFRPRLGGVATCGYELAHALSLEEGVSVQVFTQEAEDAASFDQKLPFRVNRLRLPERGLLAVLPLAAHLFKSFKKEMPDSVICMLWLPDAFAFWCVIPLFKMFKKKIPNFSILVHGVEVLDTKRNWKTRLRRLLIPFRKAVFRKAKAIFAVSQYTKTLVIQNCSVPDSKIMIVHNGVHTERFSNANPTQAHFPNRKVLLTVSRLDDYKGIDRVISCLRGLKEKIPDILYVVCGNGPDRERLEFLATFYKVKSSIHFAGTVSEQELNAWYKEAKAFALLSREDLLFPNVEGFGIVFLEAAAAGIPIVGGLSGGIPDAVDGARGGYLVDPTSDQAITAAILAAFLDSSSSQAKTLFAHERARLEFTWQASAKRILQCVD